MNASLEMNSQSNSDTAAETTNFCSFSENLRKNNNSDHYIYNNNINYSNKCLSPFMLNAPTTGRHNVSFVDVGVQTDDQMISHCDNEAHLKDNILIAPYNFDDFKASSDLDIFVDAVKCVYAEVKLELAEMIVNNLIGKYAEPLDTYNPVANLPRANTLCFNTTLNSNKFNNNKSLTFNDKSRSDHNSPTYFWPIFKLLLTQSEPQIFPDLYEPSLSEHELYDQSNRLAFDIRRTKSKLNILQSLQSRQSQENIITSATTISTSATSTITSNFENSPNCNQFHSSNDLVKTSQCSQRDSFIACLYDVRKNYKAYKSKTIPSNDLEHSKSPRSLTTQHRTPSHYGNQTAKYEKSLEQLLTNLHAKSSSNNANESTPSIYTDPKDCPLSLLSFVTNLNNLSSEEKEEGKQRKQQANYRRHHEAQPNRPPYKTSSHEDSLPLSSSSSSYTITDPKNEIMSSSMLNCPSKSNTTNNTTVTASNSNSFNNSTDLRSPAKIVNSEAIHNIEYSTFTERHSQQSNPPTTSVHDKTISPSKDDPDTFHYFIAGKYDPVKQQVLTWDAELAKMYNLEIRTNRE
ncbi:unnamed protein product [Heterobilharzia americana]|nr:unnamed protein product [Heterobilharzia americana]